MTTPPAPPAPTADPPAPPSSQPPAPPAPPAPPPSSTPPPAAPTAEDLAKLTASLDAERKRAKTLETELAALKAGQMTDQEKAVAAAREEGRAEAAKAAALVLVAAEFRAAAAGKLADPDAAIAVLDLAKLVAADGSPDKAAIAALVGKLAAVPPAPGSIPGGPRGGPPSGDGDWLHQVVRGAR